MIVVVVECIGVCVGATVVYARQWQRYRDAVWCNLAVDVQNLGLSFEPRSTRDNWCAVGSRDGVGVEVMEFSTRLRRYGIDFATRVTRLSAKSRATEIGACGLYRGMMLPPDQQAIATMPGLLQFRRIEERPGELDRWVSPELDEVLRCFPRLDGIHVENGLFTLVFAGGFERHSGLEDSLRLLVELQRRQQLTIPDEQPLYVARIPAVRLALATGAGVAFNSLAFFSDVDGPLPRPFFAVTFAVGYVAVLVIAASHVWRRWKQLPHVARRAARKRKDGIYRS